MTNHTGLSTNNGLKRSPNGSLKRNLHNGLKQNHEAIYTGHRPYKIPKHTTASPHKGPTHAHKTIHIGPSLQNNLDQVTNTNHCHHNGMNSVIDKDRHRPTSSTHLKLNTHSKSISETSSQKRSLVTQPPNNRITKQAKHEQDILQNSNTNIRAKLAAQAHAKKILSKS